MAGDWVKMRVWLARDPRVIRMADYLAVQRPFMNWLTDPARHSCKETAYEHVTRNVTVALCVTGLLVTWGTAREQGNRFDDDLILDHCDKYTFDAITDITCFGEAMEVVGWLVENENGSVTFPKFFKDNESPDDKHKRQAAERQARFREKQQQESNVPSNAKSNVTDNVTVTHREEKRRSKPLKEKQPIPDWVPADAWAAWEAMRVSIKKPLTPRATNRALTKLAAFKAKGYDLTEILDRAENGKWTDLYEPKESPKPVPTGNTTQDFMRRVLA